MKELLDYLEYAKLLGYASLAIIVITYIVHVISREYRWPKYIPGLIMLGIGIYSLFTLGNDATWLKGGVTNIVITLTSMGSGIIGLFFGLILGIYNKPVKKKRIKKDKKEE